MSALKQYLAWLFYKLGFSAASLTFIGLLLAALSGLLVFQGHFILAAAALLSSGFLDLMDGAVARLSGTASEFGGVLDSSLDRYGDAAILGGVLFYYSAQAHFLYATLAFSALVGSFEISYVRARAECEMDSCRVGFWERGERIVYLSIGLLAHNLPPVIAVLAIGTHWTAARRLLLSKQTQNSRPSTEAVRVGMGYFLKVACLVALALFVHLA